ncbi:hypothetical protein KCP71_08390 [Salmonella enterica subsp. enterica]|nr:hypothetical protein KCP71_08390 [Salmonella enterica subsp. enterica]
MLVDVATRRRVYRRTRSTRFIRRIRAPVGLVSSLAERDIYRRQRRRRFPPERRGTGMVANTRHTAKAATGARCAMGEYATVTALKITALRMAWTRLPLTTMRKWRVRHFMYEARAFAGGRHSTLHAYQVKRMATLGAGQHGGGMPVE